MWSTGVGDSLVTWGLEDRSIWKRCTNTTNTKDTNTKDTNTQIHKYTSTQIHKYRTALSGKDYSCQTCWGLYYSRKYRPINWRIVFNDHCFFLCKINYHDMASSSQLRLDQCQLIFSALWWKNFAQEKKEPVNFR